MTTFPRAGIGYDIHRLVSGRKLIIGGVEIPYELGLEGHSDADVLSHALCDALLGAACLGDIGRHFPDKDPRYKGASSLDLLSRVVQLITERGYAVGNVDCVILAERPKLALHIAKMQQILSEVLLVPADQIGIKAKTNEGLDSVGRGEAIAANAIAFLVPRQDQEDAGLPKA
ncbi:MAG TPA: 2-C-methyl-D-erythritol 2,4-cyclodiphosphate synthase [Blastocatellia bacterium]